MKFHVLQTPRDFDRTQSRNTLDEITSLLSKELRNGFWSEECSEIMLSNPQALFLFDKMEYCLRRAYGHADSKVLLNPLRIICCHKDCVRKPIITLKHIFSIKDYVFHHVSRHTDDMGEAIRLRYNAVAENPFISLEDLDAICMSPFSHQDTGDGFSDQTKREMEKIGIFRPLYCNYASHWKSRFMDWDLISPESLTFQEDDAFIYSVLNYPNPVRNWDTWPTLSLYCLKIYASQSAGALGLYRGTTKNRLTDIEDQDIKEFACGMNHPGPCLSTVSKIFPILKYENETFHKGEHLFHIDLLKKNSESVKILFDKVKRFPITVGTDGQDINQGTFIYNGKLYGLKKPMSVSDIMSVGLEKLPDYIATKNPFLTGVREYRSRDFAGLFCSNSFTYFEAGSYTAKEAKEQVLKVMALVRRCVECIKNGRKCSYPRLDQQCESCSKRELECESLIPFHLLWDCEGVQYSAKNLIFTIDESTSVTTLMKSDVFTLGFGGLHLCKNLVNPARNCVLTYAGENYGIHILRAYKFHPTLNGVKNAVFLCKDRQEDFLAWLTVNSVVQNALKVIKTYHIVRVPEPLIKYHDNCKTQKRFVHPVSLCCNINGDIFILDAATPCIHAVDRTAVSKVITVGCYGLTKYSYQQKQTANDLRFSYSIRNMVSTNDVLYIADPLRGEIIILSNAAKARTLVKSPLYTITMENCSSLATLGDRLAVLIEEDGRSFIKVIKHGSFPNSSSESKKKKFVVNLSFETVASLCLSKGFSYVFRVDISCKHFGALGTDGKISFFMLKKKKVVESQTDMLSIMNPGYRNGILITVPALDKTSVFRLKLNGSSIETEEIAPLNVSMKNVVTFHKWGAITYMIRKADANIHLLEEFGPLEFGLNFSKAVNSLYDAVSYHPRTVRTARKIQLSDAIEGAAKTVKFFSAMQESKEQSYPKRTTFVHQDGMPWSGTIKCVEHTVGSWKALERRLDQFDVVNRDKIDPHVITNESVIEHTFGTQTRRGQGNNQPMKDYIETKRLNAVDFQIRMCKTPFNQKCLSKVFNKSYQDLDQRYLKISFKELCEIFKTDSTVDSTEDVVLTDEQLALLNKAYKLSKSVPRQSGRTKWRAQAGHAPDMLPETSSPSGILYQGDLLLYIDIDDTLQYFTVVENYELTNVENKVKVVKIGSASSISVTPDRFVTHEGMIFTVPLTMYSISNDNTVSFMDNEITSFIESLKFSQTQMEVQESDNQEEADIDFRNENENPMKRSLESSLNGDEAIEKRAKLEYGCDANGQRRPLLRGDCVLINNGSREGHYALFTGEVVEAGLIINYFELKYGKYLLKEGDIEPRRQEDMIWVDYDFDKHNRYSFV